MSLQTKDREVFPWSRLLELVHPLLFVAYLYSLFWDVDWGPSLYAFQKGAALIRARLKGQIQILAG